MHQQGKLVGVAITFEQNKPIFSMLMPRTKWKNLDKSSFLVFSIFSSLVGFGSRPTNILYQYISSFRWLTSISYRFLSSLSGAGVSSLEVKYDILRNGHEGT